jgi:endoribonuclease Dicer
MAKSTGNKMIADFIEALIAAYYIDLGILGSVRFMNQQGIISDQALHLLDGISQSVNRPAQLLMMIPSNRTRTELEQLIGYTFKDKSLLEQAFAHTSTVTHHGLSYERFEFLGDAVLDWLITKYIYEEKLTSTAGELSDLRQITVNNESFGRIVIEKGLYRFIRLNTMEIESELTKYVQWYMGGNHEGDAPNELELEGPKLLGDVFESLAGAILIDAGFDADMLWNVMRPMVVPFLQKHGETGSRKKHPVRLFGETLHKLGYNENDANFV